MGGEHDVRPNEWARLRAVDWHDLRRLSRAEIARELTLSVPWLLGSLAFYRTGWWAPGALCSFFFFLTGLRQAHGAQHYSLGVGRRAQDLLLFALGTTMVASLHAMQATHLHHHRECLGDSDFEAATARMPWWRALAAGPWFILMLHRRGYDLAKPAKRRWIRAELVALAMAAGGVLLVGSDALRAHLVAMLVGECLTGFFAVWTVHHDCDPQAGPARTQRGWWKNLLSYEMFYHLEHHLFPAVPTPKLPELAARLDALSPRLEHKQVY